MIDFEEFEMEEGFHITDDNMADWALRKISEEQKEFDRIKSIAENQIMELQDRIKYEEEKFERKTSFLKSCLNGYFRTVPHKESKTQESYKLLSGSLVMKKANAKMIKDDDSLLEYLKSNDMTDFIKIEEKPVWTEFKKELQILDGQVVNVNTGEVVSCIGIEEIPESFDIKL